LPPVWPGLLQATRSRSDVATKHSSGTILPCHAKILVCTYVCTLVGKPNANAHFSLPFGRSIFGNGFCNNSKWPSPRLNAQIPSDQWPLIGAWVEASQIKSPTSSDKFRASKEPTQIRLTGASLRFNIPLRLILAAGLIFGPWLRSRFTAMGEKP
jgi:hypothetical protein